MHIYLAKMDSNLVKNSGLYGQVLSTLRNDLPFSQKPAASKVLHIPHGLISSFPNVFKAIAVGKNHCVLQMLITTLTTESQSPILEPLPSLSTITNVGPRLSVGSSWYLQL